MRPCQQIRNEEDKKARAMKLSGLFYWEALISSYTLFYNYCREPFRISGI